MELLLINHPLDCPICDKGGECPLQNQAMSSGRTESRFVDTKRTFPKPIPISTQVLLDRERCVLCQRCTRFSEQIAGDPFIELLERGAQQQIGVGRGQALPELLLRQHDPDLPGRRAHERGLPVPVAPVRPGVHAHGVRALRVRQRDAHRHPPRRRPAADGGQRPGGQRGVDRRQEPVRVPLPHRARTGSPGRWSASPTARWPRRPGPRRCRSPRGACWPRARAASACSRAAGSPSRTPTPTASSPGWRRAPTTSTSAPGRTRPRSWTFLAAHVVGQGPESLRLHAPRGRVHRALRGAGAGGGGADRLPAPPQGGAQARPERLPPRAVDHARRGAHLAVHRCGGAPGQGQPHPGRARGRGRGARRPARGRAHRARAGRGDPGRRARRGGAGPVLGGVRAGRPHGRGGRLGAAPRGRAGRARRGCRCPPCCPAAGRSPTPPTAPRSRRPGASPRARCPPRRAATPTPSSPRPGWASWPRSWSAGSTRTTWPIRPPRSRACARSGSW